MQRIKCTISYDGTLFSGYQVQLNARTVQGELEKVLKTMHKQDVKVIASGRTDAGVHAIGQVIHFNTSLSIPAEKWVQALNAMLPADIAVQSAEYVSDTFHARYDAKGKQYQYVIDLSEIRNPLKRNYTYHYPYTVDIERIKEACSYAIGTHDFSSFCAANTSVVDKVRTITDITCKQVGKELILIYTGSGFLYNMVRILTGTLLEIGTGMKSPEEMKVIIEARNRSAAGKTAPAQGLYLQEVYYE